MPQLPPVHYTLSGERPARALTKIQKNEKIENSEK
jgi:hypothetical protein